MHPRFIYHNLDNGYHFFLQIKRLFTNKKKSCKIEDNDSVLEPRRV